MRLDQIQQVLELAKCGSFSAAARNLYMSQPNLSFSIRQLESELNCRLFIRSSGGVIPTPEGRALIEQMTVIDDKISYITNFYKSGEPHRITLKVATVNHNRITPLFVKITQKYLSSPINFSFIQCNTLDEVIEKVATCQVDFAVIGIMSPYLKATVSKLSTHQIEYHRLCRQSVTAVVGPENRFYNCTEPLDLSDLEKETLITFSNESSDPENTIINSSFFNASVKGHITVSSGSLYYEMINHTPAIGIVTTHKEPIYQNEKWPDLHFIPLKNYPAEAETGWIKLRRLPVSDLAAELLEMIQELF